MSKYQYFRDFKRDLTWRWDGSIMELLYWGDKWVDDTSLYPNPESLNSDSHGSMIGTPNEAVRVDENGVRI